MPLLAEVKQFVRDMVRAIDVSLDRVDRLGAPQRLVLTSQLVGSCDTLASLLVFFGRAVPSTEKFAQGGRRRIAKLRTDARRMRSEAFVELFAEEEPEDEPSTDEQAAAAAVEEQPAAPAEPEPPAPS